MELFGRSRSNVNSFVYTVIKMHQTLMDSKKKAEHRITPSRNRNFDHFDAQLNKGR